MLAEKEYGRKENSKLQEPKESRGQKFSLGGSGEGNCQTFASINVERDAN